MDREASTSPTQEDRPPWIVPIVLLVLFIGAVAYATNSVRRATEAEQTARNVQEALRAERSKRDAPSAAESVWKNELAAEQEKVADLEREKRSLEARLALPATSPAPSASTAAPLNPPSSTTKLLPSSPTSTKLTPASDTPNVLALTSADLAGAFDANQFAAEKRYAEQTVMVTGMITRIGRSDITFAGGSTFWSVHCEFRADQIDTVAQLIVGGFATVTGFVEKDSTYEVNLNNCVIESFRS